MDTNQIQKNNDNSVDKMLVERLKELPKVIQDAILYSRWQDVIRDLSRQYNLRIDQSTMLENMVLSMMLGMTETEEFFEFLKSDLQMPEDKAIALFKDIDFKIFTNIYEKIIAIDKSQEQNSANKKPEINISENKTWKENVVKPEPVNQNSVNELKVNTNKTWKDPQPKTPDQKIDEIVKRQNFVKEDRQVSDLDNEILTLTREEILKGIEEPDSISLAESNNLPGLSSANVMPQQGEKFEIRNSKFETPRHPSTELRTSSSGQANLKHEIPNPKFQANTKQVEVKEKEIPADLPIISTPKPFSANKDNLSNMEVEESNNPIDPVSAGLNNKISTSIKDSYKVADPYKEPIE